jgi:hypothetical protein
LEKKFSAPLAIIKKSCRRKCATENSVACLALLICQAAGAALSLTMKCPRETAQLVANFWSTVVIMGKITDLLHIKHILFSISNAL